MTTENFLKLQDEILSAEVNKCDIVKLQMNLQRYSLRR